MTIDTLYAVAVTAAAMTAAGFALATSRSARHWRRMAQTAQAERERAAQTAGLTPQQIAAVDGLRRSLASMSDVANQYKAFAEALQASLEATRHERDDYQIAVNYHLDTIRQLSATNEQLYGQVQTLQAMYASRTEAALKAGLTRFVVGDDAGFIHQ